MPIAIQTTFEEHADALDSMQARLNQLEALTHRHELTIQALIRWTPEDPASIESLIDTKLLNIGMKTPTTIVWPSERSPFPAIDHVISNVAHELDHVLAVLMTEIDHLCDLEGIPPAACNHLDEIHAHHHMAAQLTHQLTKLLRRIDSDDHRTHLSDHLSQLRTLILTLCGDTIRLELNIEEDIVHPAINPSEFDQLILNLCLNACNAMPNGGTLSIQLCELEQSDRPLILIVVSDTGGGLSVEQQVELSHSFQKQASSHRGYGLSIVNAIVRKVEGTVKLDSQPGQGTQVSIYLPY